MNRFELKFFSLKATPVLTIESAEDISELVLELMVLFANDINTETNRITIEELQHNTQDLKNKIAVFSDKYKSVVPQLHQFKKFFDSLDINEPFFVYTAKELSIEQIVKLGNILQSLTGNSNFDELNKICGDYFQNIFDNYRIVTHRTDRKNFIGEGLKQKRVCRFCKKKYGEVTFKNEAHAISEALGNKCVIVNDECDVCNSLFNDKIEGHIICYLSLFLTHFGIRGKEQVPKIKGVNFEYQHHGNRETSITYKSDDVSSGVLPQTVKLNTHGKIATQNIYKSLCKFALSIIESSDIQYFEKTIDWIRTDFFADKLPKIAILSDYNFFKWHPEMVLYIRKTDNKKLPFMVGEFQFTFQKFVFIVPFSNQDEVNFVSEDEYRVYWESFKHYNITNAWKFEDFSDSKARKVNFKINFQKN